MGLVEQKCAFSDKVGTNQVAEILKHKLVRGTLAGRCPRVIVSDQDPLFQDSWKKKWPGVKFKMANVGHPQSDGTAERLIKAVKERLKAFTQERLLTGKTPLAWDELLPTIEVSHNSVIHSSTKKTPYHAALGFDPTLDHWPATLEDERYMTVDEREEARARRLQEVYDQLKKAPHFKQLEERRRPLSELKKGEGVFLKWEVLHNHVHPKTLEPLFVGPYEVVSTRSNHVKVDLGFKKEKTFNRKDVKTGNGQLKFDSTPPAREHAIQAIKDGRANYITSISSRRGKKAVKKDGTKTVDVYVSWKGCNPTLVTNVDKRNIPADIFKELYARSFPPAAESREKDFEVPFQKEAEDVVMQE